jgi:class 3 adenylate cyclase
MALAGEKPPSPELRKIVTVVFSDLCDSTKLGESLDPESLRQVITRYFGAMRDALELHDGAVEKYIGDAVMAVFGTPAVREDDALRAVRAAAEMQTALEELNEQLELRWGVRLQARTGVNTGEVIVGDAALGQGLVTGDAVNVAARLEQVAAPGEILIGRHTLELAREAVQVEPVPPLDLKGKSEPVPAFRLIGVAGRDATVDRQLSSPLVGRERELDLLRDASRRAADGRACVLVTLVGPAGIGKSRLAEDFSVEVAESARVVGGRCLSYGEGLTFWPLRAVIEALAGTDDRDAPETKRARLAELLPADDDTDLIVERVAGALGWSEASARPEETFWAVRKLLEASAADGPLVVLLEDLHWGEPTFLDLVESVAGTISGAPVLIVATARGDLLDARPTFGGAAPDATTIELNPLGGSESQALVEHLIGDTGVGEELSKRILSGAEGNPLFVEELVRMLVEDHRLERDEAGLSQVRGQAELSAPPTIHALLAARLDRLDTAERSFVEAAAVIGRSFPPGAVRELLREDDRAEPGELVRALVRKQLIEPDGGRVAGEATFSFAHMMIRDVAYRGSLKEQRVDLHERFAGWLERTAGERAGEYEEILGHHLERAHSYLVELGPVDERSRELGARAAAWLGSSGRRALARGDIPPAVGLLERAVDLLPEDDPARQDLALKLGIALAETGQLSRAGALLHDRLESERRGTAFLVFHDATGREHVLQLDQQEPPVTVGRLPESDLALTWDNEVSRRHAELLRGPEGWTLVDEQSRNGSYLNGRRVVGRDSLRNGDVLRFGDTVVLFRAPERDRQAPVPVAPDQATSFGQPPTYPSGSEG